jgi:hypothetical protein
MVELLSRFQKKKSSEACLLCLCLVILSLRLHRLLTLGDSTLLIRFF